jgi:hypothetical protein
MQRVVRNRSAPQNRLRRVLNIVSEQTILNTIGQQQETAARVTRSGNQTNFARVSTAGRAYAHLPSGAATANVRDTI